MKHARHGPSRSPSTSPSAPAAASVSRPAHKVCSNRPPRKSMKGVPSPALRCSISPTASAATAATVPEPAPPEPSTCNWVVRCRPGFRLNRAARHGRAFTACSVKMPVPSRRSRSAPTASTSTWTPAMAAVPGRWPRCCRQRCKGTACCRGCGPGRRACRHR